MTEKANTDLEWPTIASLLAIVMFGVVLVGQAPKVAYLPPRARLVGIRAPAHVHQTNAKFQKAALDEYK